ncbi:MAG: cell division protein FtsQ/DivIB [Planctomycetota bacterium]|jgi:hypothetical protein
MSASVRVEPRTTYGFSAVSLALRAVHVSRPVVVTGVVFLARALRRPHVMRGLIALGLVVAFLAGIKGAEAHLGTLKDFQVDPACMTIREMPPWLDPDWTETIRNPFEGRESVNLFEPQLATMIHDAYRESPWIEDIGCVRKEFPNRLRIRLRIRTPLAAVPYGEQYLLVDGHGVLLPRAFEKVPGFGFPLRTVEGVTAGPPEAGRLWDSERLRAGLRVAAILTSQKKKVFDRITRIDTSLVRSDGLAGRTEILLFAAEGGGPIEWGSAPGRRQGVEITVTRKLENLERLLTHFTDMRQIKYACVQFDKPVYREKD